MSDRRLFVIEGLDGSGKGTQTKLLCDALAAEGTPYRHITFPNYDSPSSALVKLYLNGAFGTDPNDVNPYAASSFYAVDRFAGYWQDWKTDYEGGSVILADRYVTSNMIYQLSKLMPEQWDDFLSWVEDYEYDKLKLPRPTATIYLDMKPEISQKLLHHRYGGDDSRKDIHERNVAFLESCRRSALYSGEKLGWHRICCYEGDQPKRAAAIHQEIMAIIRNAW